MKRKAFPVGMIVVLGLLWLGLLGVTAWGWWVIHSDEGGRTAAQEVRLVWSQSGLVRFVLEAGAASLAAIAFLVLAVGAGKKVQEKAERASE